jgi:uncharacterized alkaline shock family protein YloU
MTTIMWDTLPCGTDPETLLAYAADRTAPPPGSHHATCPYCQAAISEFIQLWGPVRQWATSNIALPDRFVATIIHRVRRLVQSPRHAADITARGTTTVTSWVLGLIASDATHTTPGVTQTTTTPTGGDRSGAVRYGADDVDIDEIGALDIAVTLSLTAQPVPNLIDLADTVRHNIITAISRQTHIHTAQVDITIDDLASQP